MTEPITSVGAARGALVTVAGQSVKLLLLLVNLVVLGRLLTPSDFGLVAIVLSIAGIAELIRDFGLSSAAVQRPFLSQAEKSNLFWINSGLGLCVSLIVCALAVPLGDLYGDARLVPVSFAIAIVFVFNGIQTQYQVELTRSLRFITLSVTDILAQAVGLICAIIMALWGYGYWALLGLQIAAAVVLLMSRVFSARWHPGLPRRGVPMGAFLRYGWNLGLSQIIGYVANNTANVVLGLRWSPATVGHYTRANQIVTIPVNQFFGPLTNVMLPMLSRLDAEPFLRMLRRCVIGIGYVGILCFSLLFVLADPIVRILLGPEWIESIPILRALAIGALFQSLTFPYYWVFLARALTGRLLRYNLVSKSLLIALTVVGAQWGAVTASLGFAVGLALSWPISLIWLRGLDGLPVRAMSAVGGHVISVAAIVTVPAALVLVFVQPLPTLPQSMILGSVWLASLLAVAAFSRATRQNLSELFRFLPQLIKRKATPA